VIPLDDLRFEVLRADARQIHLLHVTRVTATAAREVGAVGEPHAG
jgi:Mg2+/Co2+ transporter CorC